MLYEVITDDAELTRTRKVRRGYVTERYDEIISALYSQNDHLNVETTITYQDGRTATLQTRLRIETLANGRITSYNVCYTKLLRILN